VHLPLAYKLTVVLEKRKKINTVVDIATRGLKLKERHKQGKKLPTQR